MKPATPSTLRTTCVTSLLPLLLLPALGMAATRTVTTLADATNPNDGVLSLREAIGASVNGDTINFSVAGTITLINGELLIGRSIAINGPALASLAVSGNNASRVFNISSNISVNISSLTISSGYLVGGEGGGIHNNGNNLTVSNCTLSGNVAGFGGGIFNGQGHNLTVNNCTFSGNSAQGTPIGGVGVGIFNAGTLTVNNSTFSRNSAFQLMGSSGGGGIFNSIASGGLNIINILNTIIADNTGAYDRDIYSAFAVISQGHNLIGDSGSSVGWVGSDLLGTTDSPLNPQLGPLMDNGGPTFTMALLPISAAIDAGDDVVLGSPYNLSTDQRGRARRTGDHVDIGAYEFGGMTRLVTTLTDSGGGSLRGALALAMDFDRILFAPVVRGTILLTNELLINKPLSIVGPGAPVLAISGNTNSRVFHIGPQGNVDIYGLTITEGRVVGTNGIDGDNSWPRPPGPGGFAQGGGVFNEGILRILDSMIVSNNVQGGRGGNGISADFVPWNGADGGEAVGAGIYSVGGLLGFLELNRCTLTGNRAVGGDGGSGGDYLFTPAVTAPGWGGYASGAGASANSASLESCTVAANLSTGGQGGRGGQLPAAPFYDAGGPGGLAAGGGLSGGLTLTNCSVSGNSVTGGMGGTGSVTGAIGTTMAGGVNVLQLSSVQSTIIAGNTGSATSPDVNGAVTSQGWNLIGITDGSSGWMLNDLLGNAMFPLNPLLGACQDNGGPVWTMGLLAGSPARDAGHSGLPTDARGGLRIVDFPNIPNAPGGDGSDIGALEVDSLFRITSITKNNSFARVKFKSDPGTTYQLQQTGVMTNQTWTNIVGTLAGTGQELEATDTGPLPLWRFYRVRAD